MTDPHADAKLLYLDYLARLEVLERHRAYAKAVAKATGAGSGQTPVEPLATMGKDGGPLRCDVCRDPMILEGGRYQGVFADEAWRKNPQKGWTSWISGGMVVQIEGNGTLRVYHGYPGRSGCVTKADRADRAARAAFAKQANSADTSTKLAAVRAYLKAELPAQHNDAVMSDVYKVLFVFDPGLGINARE
jgi:hypothetical protein